MNIVIIGGVAAGAKAAAKIKRLLPTASVKVFTDDTHVSYSACGLPYYIQGNFKDYRALLVRSVEEFKKSGIDVFLEHKVTKIDPKAQNVTVSNSFNDFYVPYDRLIIATGARPFIPNIKGVKDYKNIFTLRKIEDGINIREKMLKSKRVVILGSGYIGLELLEAFVHNGLHTTVIERKDTIMPIFDADMSKVIKDNLESIKDRNFDLITGESVVEVQGEGENATKVITSSGREIETDFVVLCAGIKPNVELAGSAGIIIGNSGAIKVNKLMQTSLSNIYACGDCCEEPHIINGQSVWVPLGSTANKEGRCAALNAAGVYTVFEGVLGSSVTKCLNTTISMTGFTEKVAKEYGYTPISVSVYKNDMVSYMPGAGDITLKVVADKITGLILGGQAVGSVGADKRINALASALIGKLTVKEFANNDLTYSPPFSTTIDPLLDAMNLLCAKLGC